MTPAFGEEAHLTLLCLILPFNTWNHMYVLNCEQYLTLCWIFKNIFLFSEPSVINITVIQLPAKYKSSNPLDNGVLVLPVVTTQLTLVRKCL